MPGFNGIDPRSFGTDKSSEYMANYDTWFRRYYAEPVKLLELGIQDGGSLRLWEAAFRFATIAGLDLNPSPVPDTDRIRTFRGFQQDIEVLDQIGRDVAPEGFDIIIDDASHVAVYTAASFWHLFVHHLKPGGIYVIDDWDCGYRSDWPDGKTYAGTPAAIGMSAPPRAASGPLEAARRLTRSLARPVASVAGPKARARLEPLYMKIEGSTLPNRFRSHDYGMVGFIKQLVDATSVETISGGKSPQLLRAVHVYHRQVFIEKAGEPPSI